MKNIKNSSAIFMIIGMIILALTQFVTRATEYSDWTKGLAVGIGFGFLILSLVHRKRTSSLPK